MSKTVLITGATSGIGRACAEVFADAGYQLIICGRRADRLQQALETLGRKTKVHTLVFDVSDKTAVFEAIASIPAGFSRIDILINNAGNAHGLDFIQDGDVDDWDKMMDINVKGLLYVTKAVLPVMQQNRAGHIVNIGSIAGKEVYPKGNVYCASKHAVDALTRGMLMDLNEYGIKVSAVNPGLVETEFSKVRFKGDVARAAGVYQGYTPLTAADVAEVVYFVASRPPHVNISDLVILPTDQASATVVKKKAQQG